MATAEDAGATLDGPVRLLLADDHAIWRSGLRAELVDVPGGAPGDEPADEPGDDRGPRRFVVVAETADAPSTIAAIDAQRPDLVVCDLHMPGGGGIEVARQRGDATAIVILTVSEAERDLLDAVAAGARGYLVKTTPPDQLRRALAAAADGEPVFSPQLASLVLGEFRRLAKKSGKVEVLSDREREVLQHVARGHTYAEIGETLFISPKTVENHVRNILKKLHLNRRQELIRFAVEHGID